MHRLDSSATPDCRPADHIPLEAGTDCELHAVQIRTHYIAPYNRITTSSGRQERSSNRHLLLLNLGTKRIPRLGDSALIHLVLLHIAEPVPHIVPLPIVLLRVQAELEDELHAEHHHRVCSGDGVAH